MANMREVSKASGVSLASVSRILAGDPLFRVRTETRQKVLEAAKQLGYQYNAREHAKIRKVGCALSFTAEKYLDKYFSTILSAIENNLHKAGCSLSTLSIAGNFEETEEMLRWESLSGLVLFDDTLTTDKLERLNSVVPCIVGVDTDYKGIDNISHDEYRTGVQAMEHLMERGHRRIAYIGGGERALHGREFAYADLMQRSGFPILPGYMMDCSWELDRCHDMILQLCAREDRPTAIFAGSDNLAIAVLSAVQSLGLSTPDDLAVVGVNNLDFSAYTSPTLTTVSIPMEEIGAAAAELLLRRIGGFAGLPVRVLYPTTLIVRNST